MTCHLCKSASVARVAEAIDAGWAPSYFVGNTEVPAPVCASCCRDRMFVADDGELTLRERGKPAPPAAAAGG